MAQSHLAHTPSASGHADPVHIHLREVARLAEEFCTPFGAQHEARIAGLLHDLGKYGCLFQRVLQKLEKGIDHWSPGACAALKQFSAACCGAALAIHGHHIGLGQLSTDFLNALKTCDAAPADASGRRLSSTDIDALLNLLKADGITMPSPPDAPVVNATNHKLPASVMLDIRMLFSALVDADFLATEAHFNAKTAESPTPRPAGPQLDAKLASELLDTYISTVSQKARASDELATLRTDLLQACREAAELQPGLFTLTAPTGSGKTLSMLSFALRHAAKHNLRRVVVVIPYLSIIEQTVQVYRNALAQLVTANSEYILEDHSLAEGRTDSGSNASDGNASDDAGLARLLSQNWDAPIIITTSVQFLESLMANRPSACRKLHRLADSVILFDEVQTLPAKLAVPTLATLSRLAERYNSTVVFSTATQPAFSHLNQAVQKYCGSGWGPREIAPPELKLFERSRRTRVQWPTDLQKRDSWDDIADDIAAQPQSLCIVNLKRHALELTERLQSRDHENLLHLSTSMCPAHRKQTLAEVHAHLEHNRPCTLISTQCVEAGVDVDFPVVYRAWGPLDAIAQAAGRCNREGRSAEGAVHLFIPDDGKRLYPDGTYTQAADVTKALLNEYGADKMDISDARLFDRYYRELYDLGDIQNRQTEVTEAMQIRDFTEVAARYHLIDNATINVLVPYQPALEVFNSLCEEARADGISRSWIKRARPYTVGVFRPRRDSRLLDELDPVPVGKKGAPSSEPTDWFIHLGEYHQLMGLVPRDSMESIIA